MHTLRAAALEHWMIIGVLGVVVLIAAAACQPGNLSNTAADGGTPGSASGRNHVPVGTRPQFARVTFSAATSFDQARALLASVGQTPYPWACSDLYYGTPWPRVRQQSVLPLTTPPPSAEQDTPAAFAASHQFLLPYPSQQQLSQLAASDQVVAIDAVKLPACL